MLKKSILIVDDYPDLLDMTADFVREFFPDFDVVTAHDATTGLEVAEEHRESLSLAILDAGLPGHTGMWLAKELQTRGINIPILIISGDPVNKLDLTGIQVAKALLKPVPFGELQAAIASATLAA